MLGSAEAGKATQEDSLSDKLVRDLLSGNTMHPEDGTQRPLSTLSGENLPRPLQKQFLYQCTV